VLGSTAKNVGSKRVCSVADFDLIIYVCSKEIGATAAKDKKRWKGVNRCFKAYDINVIVEAGDMSLVCKITFYIILIYLIKKNSIC
jgi:hypothetical protein